MKQNQAGREVCTIGIANDNQSSRAEPVSLGSGADELRQFFRSGPDITDARFREPPEGWRPAILQNFSPQSKESSARPKLISEGQK